MKGYFVTAIGTDSGKTVISTLIAKALKADYWKPVQAGTEATDTGFIKKYAPEVKYYPEAYCLQAPMSPHAAAALESVTINLEGVELPHTQNTLIVEGAGGLLVPVNDQETVFDLMKKLGLPVILVSNFYLGSINHTLLSAELLKNSGLKVEGIVFNGERNTASEEVILKMTGLKKLFHLDQKESLEAVYTEEIMEQVRKVFA